MKYNASFSVIFDDRTQIISLSPVILPWKVAVCFLSGGVVLITRRRKRISGPFGEAGWCQGREPFMIAFSLLALHNLEVKLPSDHHGTVTLLSCSFIWDGIAVPRRKAEAYPSQGPGTLNFSDCIQLRKALRHYPEQAVLWFGFERYPIVYLGYLFPRTSGTISGRLWIS